MTMRGIRVGAMDRRITLQTATETQDGYGEPVPTWSTLATVWASVRPERASEQFEGDQEHATRQTIFRIRYRSDVNEKTRISYGSQVYDITGIIEIGRREALDLTATVRALP